MKTINFDRLNVKFDRFHTCNLKFKRITLTRLLALVELCIVYVNRNICPDAFEFLEELLVFNILIG